MQKKIKIIIADDHKMFREGLIFILSKMKNMDVIGEAQNGMVLLDHLENARPDLILMDINMPKMDGIEATKKAKIKYPKIKVIALSMNSSLDDYNKMIQAGASGFILKQAGSYELEQAIDSVMKGNDYFSPDLLRNIIFNLNISKENEMTNKPDSAILTEREHKILELICTGKSVKEIADDLVISRRTVEGHKSSLMEKLGVKTTSMLIIHAIKNNLIEL